MALVETAILLAGYLFCSLAIFQLGRLALSRIGVAGEAMAPGERPALAWLAGAAILSLLVFGFTALGWINRWALAALGAASIGAGFGVKRRPVSLPNGFLERFSAVVVVVFLAVCFIAAMAPSQDSDGYRYHLGFPHLYLHAGGLIPIRTEFYSAFPQGMEMLYLYALKFGGFSVANLMHWNFLAALMLGLWAFGKRHGVAGPAACAAAAVCASSIVDTTVASASVELGLAAAVFLSFHCWLRWREGERLGWLLLASVGAGFACAVKYTGITALLVSAMFLLAAPRRRLAAALAAGAVSAVWILPWLLRNWIYFSNPLYPFLNAWFPNPYFSPAAEAAWVRQLRSFNNCSIDLSYPWEAAIRGVTPMGFAGPFFLLTPFALLALRSRLGRWVLAAAALTSLPWLFGNPITRFAIPTLAFLALAIALGLATLAGRWATIALSACLLVQAVMDFPLLIERWNKQWIIALKEIPWRRAFRIEKPEDYWRRALPTYAALEYVEANLPPSARIIAFDEQHQFFTTRLLANPYASEQSSSAVALLASAADTASPAEAAREVKGRGWTHLLTNRSFPWLEDARKNPGRWGVKVLFEKGPVFLLEIE